MATFIGELHTRTSEAKAGLTTNASVLYAACGWLTAAPDFRTLKRSKQQVFDRKVVLVRDE